MYGPQFDLSCLNNVFLNASKLDFQRYVILLHFLRFPVIQSHLMQKVGERLDPPAPLHQREDPLRKVQTNIQRERWRGDSILIEFD